MFRSSFKKLTLAFVLLLALQVSILPTQAVAEDAKTKIDRISGYVERSNRLIDSWNASLESLDEIMAETDDAIDANDFAALPNLRSRSSTVQRNNDANNATFRTLSAAEVTECSNLGTGASSIDLFPSVDDVCNELQDSNRELTSVKKLAEEEHAKVEARLAELSTAAANAQGAANAKAAADAKAAAQKKSTQVAAPKPSPKATPKVTTKKAAPKMITCRKGSQTKPFEATKCPPGWIKK